MKYNKFMYLYPPRPSSKLKFGSDTYKTFQSRANYIAQLKLNGQRNCIYRFPDGHYEMWNRHKEKHRNYSPPQWIIDEIEATFTFIDGTFTVLDCELLHNKDRDTKNILYFWDVLVLNGEYLIGKTYRDRYDMLLNMIKVPLTRGDMYYIATPNIWVAINLSPLMWDVMWEKTSISYVEGYVIKNMNAKLELGLRPENNGTWQIRCRKPHKNYSI
jgi:ATP-dependent DNA ligase